MKPCFFETTAAMGVHECKRCGFRTAPTVHPPERVYRWCPSLGYVEGEESCKTILAEPIPGWFGMDGLGDLVQYMLMCFGIFEGTLIVDWLATKTGEGCGCKTRQAKLNAAVPFNWPMLKMKMADAAWSLWRIRPGVQVD